MEENPAINVLLIEDNPTDVRLVQEILRGTPSDFFNIISVSTLAKGLEHLSSDHVDVILLDLGLPDSQGLDSFYALEERARDTPIIILTISATEELGVQAIRAGAQRFFSKEVLTPDGAYSELFPQVIHYAIEQKRVEADLRRSNERVRQLNERLRVANEELKHERQTDAAHLVDINEELQVTNEELRTSSLYARSLIEASLDPLVTISAEGVITDVNLATERVTGHSRAELINSDFSTYFTEPDKAREGYRQVFTTGYVKDYPLAIRSKSGTITDVLYNATLYRNEAGEVQGVFAAARDVTAQRRTQQALTDELAITATITRLTPPLLSPSLDFDGLVLAILDDAKRLTGSDHGFIALIDPVTKDLISHGHTQMLLDQCAIPSSERQIRFPVGADERYHALSTYAINERMGFFTNTPAEHPAATGTPDGHVPLERFLAVPVFVSDEVVGEIALANSERDYTERDVVVAGRLAEELLALAVQRLRTEAEIEHYAEHLEDLVDERTAQLAQSEDQYRTLVETANSIIATFDVQGTITFINDYGAQFFGYTPDELIGKNLMILVPEVESSGREMTPYLADIVAHPDQHTISVNENITNDGTRVWVNWVNRMLIDAEGNHIGHLTIGYDVTEQMRAEDALRDAQRLAAIGQTAAMIGHDLRNPLQGLQYIVDLQKLRFERQPPDKRSVEDWEKEQALFDRISEQVFYMDKIVGDLQDYARPIAPEHEVITIRTIIDDILESLPPADGVETVISVSDQTFVADPHLMVRVFSNLILNAVQAMPKGGTLTIGAEATDDSVAIHVSDTGVGIPAEMRDKVFSPLTTGKAKGTGLGLAVVKRIVEAHNGTITFESEEGRGTTFTVTVPQTAE